MSTGPQENLVAFEDYAAAVKRRRKLIVVVVGAFVLLGVGVTLVSTKQYTAESRVLVEPVAAPGDTSAEPVNVDTERGVAKSLAVADIAAGIMGNGAEASDLISHVAVDPVSESSILEIRYTATSPQRAYKGADAFAEAYLQFRSNEADEATREARRQLEDARDEKAQRVADLNQQLAGLDPGSVDYNQVESQRQVAQSAQNELQRQLDALDTDSADVGTVIDPAEVPSSPSSPNLVLNVGGAAVIGLIIALSLTFVLERRNLGAAPAVAAPSAPDPEPEPEPAVATVPTRSPAALAAPASSPPLPARIERPVASTPAPEPVAARPVAPADRRRKQDPSQVLGGLGVEMLGNVPRLSNDAGEPAFDAVALGGPAGEALRRLYTELRFRLERSQAQVVFVTSAVERGVTVGLAGGLAATAALSGQDALLIAGDLRQPRLHDRLGLGNDQGLAEVLRGERPLVQVLQGWAGIDTLCVVTAGRPGPEPSSLMSPDRLATQLATIRKEFALIVIEGPPVGETTDAAAMASVSDAVILAVDPRHSGQAELTSAVTTLRHAGAPVLGSVIVEARRPATGLPAEATPFPARR